MGCTTKGPECNAENVNLIMNVTFPVYTIAVVAFAGWFFFTLFCGVGFFTVPMDLINYYRRRVRFLDPDQKQDFKDALGKKAVSIEKILRDMQKSMMTKDKMTKQNEK